MSRAIRVHGVMRLAPNGPLADRRPRARIPVALHGAHLRRKRDSLEIPLWRDRLPVRSDPRRSYSDPATHAAAV